MQRGDHVVFGDIGFGVLEENITRKSKCFLGSRIDGARQMRLIEHLAEKALCVGAGYPSHKLNIVSMRNRASQG